MDGISFNKKDLIRSIALRVANKDVDIKVLDEPGTSHINSQDNSIVVYNTGDDFTTSASAAHEGSHLRFGTKISPKVCNHINSDYPEIARYVLNSYEDYRCNMLNNLVYKGFVKQLHKYAEEMTKNLDVKDKFLNTIMQLANYMEYPSLFNEDNTYPIWEKVELQKKLIDKYLSFASSVIVSKIIVDEILNHYDKDPDKQRSKAQYNNDIAGMKGKTSPATTKPDPKSDKEVVSMVSDYENGMKNKDFRKISKAEKKLQKAKKDIIDELKKMQICPKTPDPDYVRNNVGKVDLNLPSRGAGKPYDQIVVKNIPLIKQLRYEFKRIMRSTNAARGGRRGRISTRDLPRFVTSRGKFDRVFKIERNDYGANLMFVIDESGSMDGHKMATARETMIVLAESLEGTSINFGVVGFSASPSSKKVGERVYKFFNQPLDKSKLSKINHDSAGQEMYTNRDGDSMEIAARFFGQTNHKNSTMVVLSDGMPSHYGRDGDKKTNNSIRVLRSRGIKVHGIGIGLYNVPEYGNMYDNKDFTVLDINDLPVKLLQMVRSLAREIQIPNI